MKNLNRNQWVAVTVSLVIVFFGFSLFFGGSDNGASLTNINGMNNDTTNSGDSENNPANIFSGTINQDTGVLQMSDTKVGEGAEAVAGKVLTVNYTGMLLNGSKFDSSEGREPFRFILGAGMVISGWDEGLVGMKVGGKRHLVIPSDMAYGDRAVGNIIPANSTLVFDVELVNVEDLPAN